MKLLPTQRFRRDYEHLSPEIQRQIDDQLARLLSNPRHPSLLVKKIQGTQKIWELRITRSYRLTFQIEGDFYILRRAGPHDVLRHP